MLLIRYYWFFSTLKRGKTKAQVLLLSEKRTPLPWPLFRTEDCHLLSGCWAACAAVPGSWSAACGSCWLARASRFSSAILEGNKAVKASEVGKQKTKNKKKSLNKETPRKIYSSGVLCFSGQWLCHSRRPRGASIATRCFLAAQPLQQWRSAASCRCCSWAMDKVRQGQGKMRGSSGSSFLPKPVLKMYSSASVWLLEMVKEWILQQHQKRPFIGLI